MSQAIEISPAVPLVATDSAIKARFLSYRDAAAYLAVSERLVRKLVASRKLPCVKIGRCARIPLNSLEKFADSLPSR